MLCLKLPQIGPRGSGFSLKLSQRALFQSVLLEKAWFMAEIGLPGWGGLPLMLFCNHLVLYYRNSALLARYHRIVKTVVG